MKKEHGNDAVRKKLEAELADVCFSDEMKQNVMRKLDKTKTPFWERELTIPVPAAAGWGLLIVVPLWLWIMSPSSLTISSGRPADGVRHSVQQNIGKEEQPSYVALAGNVFRKEDLSQGWQP